LYEQGRPLDQSPRPWGIAMPPRALAEWGGIT